MSALDELVALLPPPDGIPADGFDWMRVEDAFQTAGLPMDLEDLVDRYGGGWFDGFLAVHQPRHPDSRLDFETQADAALGDLQARSERGEELPVDGYVEAGGGIVWGSTEEGDRLWFKIDDEDEIDAWPVIVEPHDRSLPWQQFDMTATEFVLGVLQGDVKVDAFPPSFPRTPLHFVPGRGSTDA